MNSITINGKTLELQKTCPDCEGKSAYANMSCWTCGSTGIVERYWTPEEAEEVGLKMLDTDPVWVICWMEHSKSIKLSSERYVSSDSYSAAKKYYNPSKIIILHIIGQPAPPKDYRP